ncbi:hypothetical protein POJ06DRAFT_23371 [Lipomyces tetrasporus]|uniref:peptidylprolyl isomerase n=1 Tax=Lipomyces tetrasporus TaxID=54092 RepID=A0AAD7QM52_9ASCO|nr:uncharacterized protein POJ06DRAFT_23371 [Lipomyces tetrasporus]KAJ8097846.1 hypothetical protein POJ06DRAFT_23371 [Lipomyces tetrasporus]
MPLANGTDTGLKKRVAEDEVVATGRSHEHEASERSEESVNKNGQQELRTTDSVKRKRRILKHENVYLNNMPSFERYTKSFMHQDTLCFVKIATDTNFIITLSVDGILKFWKKRAKGIEFVKQYAAHTGTVLGAAISIDGKLFASVATDNTIKIFDVVNFDMINILNVPYTPNCVCWLQKRNQPEAYLAVSDKSSSRILIYDGRGDAEPIHVLPEIHRQPVKVIGFNAKFNCAVSVDVVGMIEYWRPEGNYEKPDDVFQFKSSTDLFEFRKNKCSPTSIEFSPNGRHFVTLSLPDRQVRIFDYHSGKLHRKYDESIAIANEMQQAGTALRNLDDIEFGRRVAVERELDRDESAEREMNAIFDESGNFVLYPTYLGIKVVNIVTNKCVRLLGSEENIRFLNLALYQGAPNRKEILTLEMATSDNVLVSESFTTDPTLIATAIAKKRFYLFTNYEGEFSSIRSDRDVLNEKITKHDQKHDLSTEKNSEISKGVTLHTTLGDIQIRLYPEHAPLAVENFVTLCKRGYYDSTIFHRVIKKFMIQGGDPLGDGTGGESMWGKEFKDEFSVLRHDRPYTVSMANAGPNTNGSQFFITTEKTSWLDNKHTIFGRVVMGMDIVKAIENLRTDKYDKPENPPSIVSTTVL